MSRLEALMLVALGFAVAALLALLLGRLAWKLAFRLGARHALPSAPAALIEMRAECHRLRAEQAMLERKVELRLGELNARVVERMAEVMRNRNRIGLLMSDIEERDRALAVRAGELSALRGEQAQRDRDLSERAAALQVADAEVHSKEKEIAQLSLKIAERDAALAERDRQLAALEEAMAPAAGVVPELQPQSVQDRLKRRIDDLTALSTQIAAQREHLVVERAALEQSPGFRTAPPAGPNGGSPHPQSPGDRALEARLAAIERSAGEFVAELKQLDAAWVDARPEIDGLPLASAAPAERQSPTDPARRPAGVANVLLLAQRIKALKKDITG